MKTHLLAMLMLAMPAMAPAHEIETETLIIIHPMTFETPKTARAAAGYMAITNLSDASDRLLEVRADVPQIRLHRTEEADSTIRMVHIDTLTIPAGDTIVLELGGLHVMFMGLDGGALRAGDTLPATLIFEHGGEVEVEFHVEERTGDPIDHSQHN